MKIFGFQLGQKEYTARPDMWGFRATGSPSRNLRFRDGVNFIQISPFKARALSCVILRQSLPTLRVTYDQVRSGVTADDNSQALPHLWQCLVFYIRCSFSRHENAQTFALLLVPRELSRSSLKMHRRSLCSSFLGNYRAAHSFSLRVAMARAIVLMGVFAPRGPRREIFDFGMG